jgi:hypothetical protein
MVHGAAPVLSVHVSRIVIFVSPALLLTFFAESEKVARNLLSYVCMYVCVCSTRTVSTINTECRIITLCEMIEEIHALSSDTSLFTL